MNHYAIELSLMLYHGDEWIRKFTYYNHGKEPPYGGVRSEGSPDPVVLDMEEFENTTEAVESWKRHVINVVKSIKPIPGNAVPDAPVEYKVDPTDDEITYYLSMDSMEMTITYDRSDKTITFAPRDAFDVSWQGFLFHHETITDFLKEIKK